MPIYIVTSTEDGKFTPRPNIHPGLPVTRGEEIGRINAGGVIVPQLSNVNGTIRHIFFYPSFNHDPNYENVVESGFPLFIIKQYPPIQSNIIATSKKKIKRNKKK